jgi:hypothetical protein
MISSNKTSSWQTTLTNTLCQDPKKTGVLGFLVVILLTVGGRMLVGGNHPTIAAGSPAMTSPGVPSAFIPSPVIKPGGAAASLRGWLSTPIASIGRNDFLLRSEYVPADATKTSVSAGGYSFWATLAKLVSVNADQTEKRDAVIAGLKVQAAALRPTSTVMGSTPRAMVNGLLVREGDTVNAFRVLKIEPHGIVIARQGVVLAVPMN